MRRTEMLNSSAIPGRSAWRLFPWIVALTMTGVIAVNGGLVYTALHSFPGNAGGDGFDLSNSYNRVLDNAERQATLGWVLKVEQTDARHLALQLTDRAGAPLTDARVVAQAVRPLGPRDTTALEFHPAGPGRYAAETTLLPGQWDVLLKVSQGTETLTSERRLVVK
jgi:nitrogen fixation protein FixH